MVIWMQHKEHGKHPAQGGEVEALLKSGWTHCPKKIKQVVTIEVTPEVQIEVPQPPQDTKRRPGRPFKNK